MNSTEKQDDSERGKFVRFLKYNETMQPTVYNDGSGNLTIGIGHKLTPIELQRKKVFDIPITHPLTEQQQDAILQKDIAVHRDSMRSYLKKTYNVKLDDLPENRQYALLDVHFNGGLHKFPKFTRAILEGDPKAILTEHQRFAKTSRGMLPLRKRNESYQENYAIPIAAEEIVNQRIKSGSLKFVPDMESIHKRAAQILGEE